MRLQPQLLLLAIVLAIAASQHKTDEDLENFQLLRDRSPTSRIERKLTKIMADAFERLTFDLEQLTSNMRILHGTPPSKRPGEDRPPAEQLEDRLPHRPR